MVMRLSMAPATGLPLLPGPVFASAAVLGRCCCLGRCPGVAADCRVSAVAGKPGLGGGVAGGWATRSQRQLFRRGVPLQPPMSQGERSARCSASARAGRHQLEAALDDPHRTGPGAPGLAGGELAVWRPALSFWLLPLCGRRLASGGFSLAFAHACGPWALAFACGGLAAKQRNRFPRMVMRVCRAAFGHGRVHLALLHIQPVRGRRTPRSTLPSPPGCRDPSAVRRRDPSWEGEQLDRPGRATRSTVVLRP